MAKEIYRESISDTNEYESADERSSKEDVSLYKFENNLDQDISVDILATDYEDEDYSSTVTIVSGITVGSGGGVEYETLSDPWDVIVFSISASTAPSGNNDFVVKKMSRRIDY